MGGYHCNLMTAFSGISTRPPAQTSPCWIPHWRQRINGPSPRSLVPPGIWTAWRPLPFISCRQRSWARRHRTRRVFRLMADEATSRVGASDSGMSLHHMAEVHVPAAVGPGGPVRMRAESASTRVPRAQAHMSNMLCALAPHPNLQPTYTLFHPTQQLPPD